MRIDDDGILNVAEKVVKRALTDFIKGGSLVFEYYGDIIDEKTAREDREKWKELNYTDDRSTKIRWFYDSWNFIKKDPYELFQSFSYEEILNEWKYKTIMHYYKNHYISIAVKALLNLDKVPKFPSNNEFEKFIEGEELVLFNKAKKYVRENNQESLFDEWNCLASERVKGIRKKERKLKKLS